jgi:two-component system chemotaxis response regulator CheB
MPGHDIIVIGASAGGVEALKELVAALPANLPATLFIVLHTSPHSPGLLPSILDKRGPLPAVAAQDKAKFKKGCIYVAVPDYHLLIEGQRMRVVRGPKENRHRPAIDPLFRSAAWSHGPRVAAVVLSGNLDDGVAGLWAVKTCGGATLVQDPVDALFPDMPASALRSVEVDHSLPLAQIPGVLIELAKKSETKPRRSSAPQQLKIETEFSMLDRDIHDMNKLGSPTAFTCPACRGALWELQDGEILRYRCHVGHAFSAGSLLEEQSDAIEAALYSGLRALEEKAITLRRLESRSSNKLSSIKARYEDEARSLEARAEIIRDLLIGRKKS